jgi:hypothetical protein
LAYSWKMSLAGQVLWKRSEVVWAMLTMGADMAPAATAAPLRRLRRRGDLLSVMLSLSIQVLTEETLPAFLALLFGRPDTHLWRAGICDKQGFHELVKNSIIRRGSGTTQRGLLQGSSPVYRKDSKT